MGKTLIVLMPIIFIAGCIGQGPDGSTFHGEISLTPIIPCASPPDASDPDICERGSTTISELSYFASLATNFACVSGKFSMNCNTSVTNADGTTVLSGSSRSSSTCDDRKVICQVPIDAKNMPAGDYTVTFTAVDDNSGQSVEESLEINVLP